MQSIRNAGESLDGHGHATDKPACNSGGGTQPQLTAPWRDSQREADKTQIYQHIRNTPNGIPLCKLAACVFDTDTEPGDANYQLTRRFIDRYPDLFKTYNRNSLRWVEPRIECLQSLNLCPPYACGKTSVQRGDDPTDTRKLAGTGDRTDHEDADTDQFAKERTQQYLDNHLTIESDAVRRSIYNQLITDKAGTEDRWQIFERIRGTGDDYLCLPYRTRYNNTHRAGDVLGRFEDALTTASGRHNTATMLTLTTDPNQHSGLTHAIENLADSKQRLMSWLSTDYQLGYRPENLTVLEFTQSGLPHLHVVLFGVPYVTSQAQLAEKWRDYGQGYVVDVRQARTAHNGDWRLHNDASGTVTLSQYLGKAIRELQEVAAADAAELGDRVDAGDISLWKQALYWASESRYVSCSPTLKPDDEDTPDLPHITNWKFVGVAKYGKIPAHVRQSAIFVAKEPPP